MTSVRGLVVVAALSVALVAPGAASATTLTGLERAALAKLKHAPVDGATKASARAEIARAAHLVRTLPNGRGYHVQVALQEAATFPGALTQPRALALYGALRANDDYFARHWAPADKTDIVGADGTVYRYFGGYCFRFHPLANFGVLNARATSGDPEGTQELADALVTRGVYQRGGGVGWEYDFRFAGGRAPWLSGMAQAVAAQAFARAAQVVPDKAPEYMRAATAAYRVIPRRLMTSVPAGPWIRLYSFNSLPVLNAQLQATISLQDYAQASGDAAAAALATRMQNAAATTLPRFDTGYWSYYALPREPSPVDYHRYVVQLLAKLAAADPRFADARTRFAAYLKQPPAFELANGGVGQVRFWLSKPASVTVETPAGPAKRLSLLDGWHTLTWAPKRAGVYPVHVTATDWLGNRAQFDALPIVHIGGAARPATRAAASADQALPPQFVVARRASVAWPDGATAPDPAVVASLTGTTFVELDALTTPTSAFAQYAASLAQQLPQLAYLVVGPAPVAAGAAQYVAAVNSVRDAVHAVAPAVAVGALVDGLTAPKPSLAALGRAGIAADVVAFRAAPSTANGAWTQPNWTLLTQAFHGTLPPLLLDMPSAAAVTAAACTPRIAGVALDPAVADADVSAATSSAARGAIVCPGLESGAAASTATFPAEVVSGQPATMQLGCVRDCLYVVTLVGANGRPVVARRGSLRGGAAAVNVALPKSSLGQPSYTLDVRLVNRVNPGGAVTLTSPPLARVSP